MPAKRMLNIFGKHVDKNTQKNLQIQREEPEVHATDKRDRVLVANIDEHPLWVMVREDGVWRDDPRYQDSSDFKNNFKPVTDSVEYDDLLKEAIEAIKNRSSSKAQGKLRQLYVIYEDFDGAHKKDVEFLGPVKCCTCGYETTNARVEQRGVTDVTFVRFQTRGDKELYVCNGCAQKISHIYTQSRPLTKILFVLSMLGAILIFETCQNIFF
jgi:hypothetical protein